LTKTVLDSMVCSSKKDLKWDNGANGAKIIVCHGPLLPSGSLHTSIPQFGRSPGHGQVPTLTPAVDVNGTTWFVIPYPRFLLFGTPVRFSPFPKNLPKISQKCLKGLETLEHQSIEETEGRFSMSNSQSGCNKGTPESISFFRNLYERINGVRHRSGGGGFVVDGLPGPWPSCGGTPRGTRGPSPAPSGPSGTGPGARRPKSVLQNEEPSADG